MTEVSTYRNRLFEIYELYHDVQDNVTTTTITVTGKEPHADVIADSGHKLQRTRVYVNGNRANVTAVAVSGSNTVITISEAPSLGDTVDIFLAATTGNLHNNTTTGKLPLVELQKMQGYSVNTTKIEQAGCNTERIESINLSTDSMIVLGLNRRGNTHMKNFIAARKNKKYLMIIVKDTTDPLNPKYEVLHEARVATIGRASRAANTKAGIITDTIVFRFVKDAAINT